MRPPNAAVAPRTAREAIGTALDDAGVGSAPDGAGVDYATCGTSSTPADGLDGYIWVVETVVPFRYITHVIIHIITRTRHRLPTVSFQVGLD